MKYELPQLNYDYSALETYIDAKTMEIHHTKHHQAYVNNLNAALEKHPEVKNDSVPALFGKLTLYKTEASASYYHDKFNGRKTASGEKFNNDLFTAAHRKFPFGTMLKVTNIASGKYVVVVVNDRGPFTKGREIDLSRKAYKTIAVNKNSGLMKVKIEVIED